MKTFTIKDKSINIKDIENKIEKNLNKRMKNKKYRESLKLIKDLIKSDTKKFNDLEYINKNFNINTNRIINSHRKIIGLHLIRIRNFLYEEIKRSIDPIIEKQIEFNLRLTKILNQTNERLKKLEKRKER